MRLSNQQIEALIAVISEKEEKAHAEATKKKREAEAKRCLGKAKEYTKLVNALPAELKNIIRDSYRGATFNEKYFTDNLTESIKEPRHDRDKLRNKILIASIDSDTLSELKVKLKIDI